ncbi:MAG TPA: SRPBCC domain-containing protein [Trinickia sp.]
MELIDALRIPLAPSAVRDALQDIALLRASLENCESFSRLPSGEYALTLTVPLGPLRARYDVRAHLASAQARPAGDASEGEAEPALHRTLNFKACATGVGSLRGQIDIVLGAVASPGDKAEGGDKHPSQAGSGNGSKASAADDVSDVSVASAARAEPNETRIDYSVWATLTGPLAELPPRQIENALHELADDFFAEFCAVVEAKHGRRANRAAGESRRQHVFLRPINLAGLGRKAWDHDAAAALGGRAAGALASPRHAHGLNRSSAPQAMPTWAWIVVVVLVAALLYVSHWLG